MNTILTLIILAVLPNPSVDDRKGEWIMLYNQSNQAIQIQEYSLATDANQPKPFITTDYSLPAKSSVILARDKAEVEQSFPGQIVISGQFSLPNRPVNIGIHKTETKTAISTFSYENAGVDEVTVKIIQCDKYKTIPMGDFDSGLPLANTCKAPSPAAENNQAQTKTTVSGSTKIKDIDALYKQLNNSYSFPELQYDKVKPAKDEQSAPLAIAYKPLPTKTLSVSEIIKLAILSSGIVVMLSEIRPLGLYLPTVPKLANLLKKWRRLIKIRQRGYG